MSTVDMLCSMKGDNIDYSCNSLHNMYVILSDDLNTAPNRNSQQIWHELFGEIGMKTLNTFLSEDNVDKFFSQ